VNDDALAAVAAAAQWLLARAEPEFAAGAAARWNVAARMRTPDAGRARLVARARSRWTLSGRLRD